MNQPKDSNGKDPMPGQLDLVDVIVEVHQSLSQSPIQTEDRPAPPRQLTAAQVVAQKMRTNR